MAGPACDYTANAETAALTGKVVNLFKENYQHGPWPNESQCYRLAVLIGVIQNNKSYKEDFERESPALRDRRNKVAAMKRFVKEQQDKFADPAEDLEHQRHKVFGSLQDVEDLTALKAALEKATPALLQPYDPLAGERDKAWWHKAARMIAARAETALVQAGYKRISEQAHGPFVRVVAGALKLATGKNFKPETVAAALKPTN